MKNSDYMRASYWNDRFETENEYEWLGSLNNFMNHLIDYLRPTDRYFFEIKIFLRLASIAGCM